MGTPTNPPIKVYVTRSEHNEFRIHMREPTLPYKEVLIPRANAYIHLTAQASADALQDSLEVIFLKTGDNILSWREVNQEADKDNNWQSNKPEVGDSNAW